MKDRIDAALRAAKASQEQILAIKQTISRDDPRYEFVDDAALGVKWLMGRLVDLAEFMPQSVDAPSGKIVVDVPEIVYRDLDNDAGGDLSMSASWLR
jgi:hypothetical protein